MGYENKRDIHLRGSMWSRTKKNHGNERAGPSRDSPLTFKQHIFSTFQPSRSWRDRRPTVKQLFSEVSSNWKNFWKKSLNGHATVVEVTRPSADCQTTFFGRFKQLESFLKKIAERSRDRDRWSRDCRPTVKQRFLDVSSNSGKFSKSRWTVTRLWSEVTRPSDDCRTTFFGRFKQFGNILKKVAER